MTSVEERIRLRLRGGPPWGFRLEGGNGYPITISKIRQRSNADDAQIQEGDEVLTINGRRVQDLPSDVAMAFVENSIGILELELLRRKYERDYHRVVKKNGLYPRRSSGDSRRLGLMNGTHTKAKPMAAIQVMQDTPSPRNKPNGAPGLTIRKTTTTTTKVLTKSDGDKTEKTVTKTVTERVGNQETTTTTQEVQLSGEHGNEVGPKTVIRETRFTDRPVEELMGVSPTARDEDDDRPTNKITIDQPPRYSPIEKPRTSYSGRNVIVPTPYKYPMVDDKTSGSSFTPMGKGYYAPVKSPTNSSPKSYSPRTHTTAAVDFESSPVVSHSPYMSQPSYKQPQTARYQMERSEQSRCNVNPAYPPLQHGFRDSEPYEHLSSTLPRQGTASTKVEIQTPHQGYRDQIPSYATLPRTTKPHHMQSTAYSYPGGRVPHKAPPSVQPKPKPKLVYEDNFGRRTTQDTHKAPSPHYPVVHKPAASQAEIMTYGNTGPNVYGAPVIKLGRPGGEGIVRADTLRGSDDIQTTVRSRPGEGSSSMFTKINTFAPKPSQPSPPPISTVKKVFSVTPPTTYEKPKPMTSTKHGGAQFVEIKPPPVASSVTQIVPPSHIGPGQQVTLSFQAPGSDGGAFEASRISIDSGLPASPIPGEVQLGIVQGYIDEPDLPEEEEKEDPNALVQSGFVKSQKKKRDIKSKRETKGRPVQRAKSFHGLPTREKGALEELSVSQTDKQKAARTIADVIMFPKDKKLKGARMFAKQRKRSAKYTMESVGTNFDHEDYDASEIIYAEGSTPDVFDGDMLFPTRPSRSISVPKGAVAIPGMVSSWADDSPNDEYSSTEELALPADVSTAPPVPQFVPPPPPPPPPPPGPPKTYNWKGKTIEATNFNIDLKSKEKCSHDIVTPNAIKDLMADMLGKSGRGAAMFKRRRDRSEEFVLDENTAKQPKPKPPADFSKPEQSWKLQQSSNTYNTSQKSDGNQTHSSFSISSKSISTSGSRSGPPPPPKPKPKPSISAEMDPKIRPKFNANGHSNGFSASPPPKPGFGQIDFNKKPRGWSGAGDGSSRDTSMASISVSSSHTESTLNTKDMSGSSIPKSPGGTHDFNAKPRGFTAVHT